MSEYSKLIIPNRADPWIYKHNDGQYYFTASVPEYDRIEIRRAGSITALKDANPEIIWTKHDNGPMSKHVWAPEIHFIDGKWYIYFAAGEAEDIWKIRPYVLECESDDPMVGKWHEKGMVQRAENDPFSFTEFSLDATTFELNGIRYLIWAQKVNGSGGISNIYIAKMKNPWSLDSVQVMLTTPDYLWERKGFWVNEGPAVIRRNGKIFISFSASATHHNYCMGLLMASENCDLLDPTSWTKFNQPVLQSDDESKIYGPGHNSFTVSEDGTEDILVYHARNYKDIEGDPLYDINRHTYVKRLNWNAEGIPVFT